MSEEEFASVTDKEYKESIKKLLKVVRKKRLRITQIEMSERLHCDNSRVSRLENGFIRPRFPPQLRKIAAEYELTPSEITKWMGLCGFREAQPTEDKIDSENLPPFTYREYRQATPILQNTQAIEQTFSNPHSTIKFGSITLNEVAAIEEAPPVNVWNPGNIAFARHPEEFNLHNFWKELDAIDKLGPFGAADLITGKHIRLAEAGRLRQADTYSLGLVWQPISWEQNEKTNGRVKRGVLYKGTPVRFWFPEEDLLVPPLESDSRLFDSPLANRFAINLAVILVTSQKRRYAIFQRRTRLAMHSGKLELGASESVHGYDGWSKEEQDVIDGNPSLLRTARRCLWQELGLAEEGMTDYPLPGFQFDLSFTALVLNKEELQPRLIGFIIVHGEQGDVYRSHNTSLGEKVKHKEFGSRKNNDVADEIYTLDATPGGLAWVLKQRWGGLSPECRVRLVLYLKHTFPNAERQFAEAVTSAEHPEWWREQDY